MVNLGHIGTVLALAFATADASLCSVTRFMVEPFADDCSVAATCLQFLANTGWMDHGLNGDGPKTGANSGFMANGGFANDGFQANGGFANDGFSGNAGFANDGFANDGFFVGNAAFLNDASIGYLNPEFGAEGGEANQGYFANSPFAADSGFFVLQPFIQEAGFQANQGFWAKGGFFYLGLCSPAIECGEFLEGGAFGKCYDGAEDTQCDPLWVGDGVCDEYCNRPEFNMDDGDCLNANSDKAVQRHEQEALKLVKAEEARAKAQAKSGVLSSIWEYIVKALQRRR